MFLNFVPNEEEAKKYKILRDYFVSNGKVQGIYFVVKDYASSEIKRVFLNKEDMNNEFSPKKVSDEGVRLKAAGIEYGEVNQLIIEKGVWKKKGLTNKIIEVEAKRYKFILTDK